MNNTVFACGDQPSLLDASHDVVVIEGLCQHPGQMVEHGIETDRAVIALHQGMYDLPAVQKALRGVGVDPLGAQIVDVYPDTDTASLLLEIDGLSARALAFAGSAPEHVKPVLPRATTRRGFLKPPAPVYVAVPNIDHHLCAAGDGCRACIEVCPQGAYQWHAGRIAYDKDACLPCGLCVTRCPVGAIENPAVTAGMLEAQVRALVSDVDGSVGIRFVCARGAIDPRPGWFDIEVPCTSMVRGTWLLACLLLGAGAATAMPCAGTGCPLELDDGAIQANDLAHAVLTSLGLESGMVSGVDIYDQIPQYPIEEPFSSDRASYIVLALARATGGEIDVTHPASYIGVVEIDASACTLCGQCAKTCPTHALIESYDGDTVSISFDALSCVNCTQCVSACPEIRRGAISVSGRISTAMLDGGRRELHVGTIAKCEVCGKAIAPAPMMNRIGDLLGEEYQATMAVLANRCLDCRGRR
ncbi:MAG: 4Fe-4S binding protein [Actinomycetia bacterium]|nr:4Fe-4S binding protein [Actinomycetes bacterium]